MVATVLNNVALAMAIVYCPIPALRAHTNMPRHLPLAFLVLGVLSFASLTSCKPEPAVRSSNIVHQIDHILIASSDPNALFSLLTGTLQLPVAWPMTDYGAFASGGVGVGNTNLEIIKETDLAAGNLFNDL